MHSDDEDLSIRIFERADTERVIALWIEAFPSYSERSAPHRDPRFAIEMKLATQPELFFVALRGARLVGTVMAGYDGHRGWLYSFAVANDARRLGIGRAMMAHAEAELAALGCRKINLQVLQDNDEACRFYAALGYQVEPLVSFGKRLPMTA
ncbi:MULTISPECIES: GNAT family acetyltransferase [Burkholderiaceae]|jgi:ribosomal protein S18 acetylase RimI-like enzyme|uniref:GNAT family acetyltransferase n=1 Tax=Burkholderia gladioli TaxID=28095 RepID=A0A104JEF6_BURGA|nr:MULTISPECIES: GNAT family acetyltransferase [Burkholderia]ATF86604.1 GNAT family acetyltransferase [Burkholderia gladioli pv. gladioli]AYQ86128.1 GNAT family acetyltransferase [Burkholderia gladioli]KAF1062913.1 Acetyltransferase YpeA [Burkholderia gladioli]KGE07201.1 acetyltransferase [Burkholderia gladioli]KVM62177.1 acetyltransferase [Burkholderia gladioli]